MRPLSHAVPKELFPIALRPMLDYTVEEAVRSGVRAVCVVLAPEKEEPVRRYFEARPPECRLEYALQPQPRGLMDAVRRAASFVGDDRFAVLLPDNLFLGGTALEQLLETEAPAEAHLIGLVRTDAEGAAGLGDRGELALESVGPEGTLFRVHAIGPEKRPLRVAAGEEGLVNVGRYLFQPDVFEAVDRVERALRAEELDDLPVLNELGAGGRVLGRVIDAEYYDVGNPIGYWRAVRRLGPGPGDHDEMADE